MRRVSLLLAGAFTLLGLAVSSLPSWSWGEIGHTLIVRDAVQLLPAGMKPFYESNSRYLECLVMLPDDWRQTHKDECFPQHFIDLDSLDSPPFTKVRVDKAAAEAAFGKDKLNQAGIVPWVIQERYQKLVAAFKASDLAEVVVQSSVVAHFVGDAHVPFHATKDWDGNKPEEKGLHFRWETNLVALKLNPDSIKPSAPNVPKDVLSSAFDWCVASYGYVDAICKADDKARERDPGHGGVYYGIMWDDTGSVVRARLTSAAEDLAGVWIAAWEEAKSPELFDKTAPVLWSH